MYPFIKVMTFSILLSQLLFYNHLSLSTKQNKHTNNNKKNNTAYPLSNLPWYISAASRAQRSNLFLNKIPIRAKREKLKGMVSNRFYEKYKIMARLYALENR